MTSNCDLQQNGILSPIAEVVRNYLPSRSNAHWFLDTEGKILIDNWQSMIALKGRGENPIMMTNCSSDRTDQRNKSCSLLCLPPDLRFEVLLTRSHWRKKTLLDRLLRVRTCLRRWHKKEALNSQLSVETRKADTGPERCVGQPIEIRIWLTTEQIGTIRLLDRMRTSRRWMRPKDFVRSRIFSKRHWIINEAGDRRIDVVIASFTWHFNLNLLDSRH